MSLPLLPEQKGDHTLSQFTAAKLFTREKVSALLVALMFAGVVSFFGLRRFEASVTFHPVRFHPDEPWMLPQDAEDVWFTTSDEVRLLGWFITSNKRPPVATVIYFHGNGGNLSHVAWVGRNLASAGFDVLLFDYRGYGRSAGETDGETGLNRDGDAAYEYVVGRRGVRPERLVLYGQSLGTTIAADVASRRACGALILESGLSSAAEMETGKKWGRYSPPERALGISQ